MLLGKRTTEEFCDDRSPARLIERIVVEYARAWRGARAQVEDPVASGHLLRDAAASSLSARSGQG